MHSFPLLFRLVALALLGAGLSLEAQEISEPLRLREVIRGNPGPWGQLEYYKIPLECPDDYLGLLTMPSQDIEWTFSAAKVKGAKAALLSSGLSETSVDALLKGAHHITDNELIRIYPTHEAIFGMNPEDRMRLYTFFTETGDNPLHRRPIYFESGNLSEWFEGAKISREAIRDIASLAYPTPRKHGFFFTDLPLPLRNIISSEHEKGYLQAVLRKYSLIVRLRLDHESLTSDLDDYWSAGFRNKAVMPLLESVVRSNNGGAIDVVHLLPSMARRYLNRYPELANGIEGRFPDWFWTCYNFFRFSPHDVYADSGERDKLILEEFVPSAPPLQFGDMLLINSKSKIIHGCIYIADDIVFTKNGADIFSPWILMKMNDMLACHDLFGDATISVRRRLETDQAPLQ